MPRPVDPVFASVWFWTRAASVAWLFAVLFLAYTLAERGRILGLKAVAQTDEN